MYKRFVEIYFLIFFTPLNILSPAYIMKAKKDGGIYERKEKSFICG